MDSEGLMLSDSPWKRGRPVSWGAYRITRHSFSEQFDSYTDKNIDLDRETKNAALKASRSVVSIVSLTDGKEMFKGSGVITDCVLVNGKYISTVLTSASLLRTSPKSNDVPHDIKFHVYLSDGKLREGDMSAYDLHYNVASITVESALALPIASLKHLDDSISIRPSEIQCKGEKSSVLHPHSDLFSICPGDSVIALGRFFDEPYDVMAAPGVFSADCCKFDCHELFRANCKISKCGIGGPLINVRGEVIGINFYGLTYTPFLPINIASKCLEQFKKQRFFRPWLGMKMTNLYAATICDLERIVQKFPDISKGVLVEEVVEGSPTGCAGIQSNDVIVQCDDNIVRSCLEFYVMMMDKAEKSVEVVVIRETSTERLRLTMKVEETPADKVYRWPVPEERRVSAKRVRL